MTPFEGAFAVGQKGGPRMNEALMHYIEQHIFPLYAQNEEGHGIRHIQTVIRRSLCLAQNYDVDPDMVYTVAAYHDLGHHTDRDNHEKVSAALFMQDEAVRNWFSDAQRQIICEAIEDHRASADHVPRSIYGKIISTADRTILDLEDTVKRSYVYGKTHYPALSEKEQIERVHTHLSQKYGEGGYAKAYLPDAEFETALQNLRHALSDKPAFIKQAEKWIQKANEQ